MTEAMKNLWDRFKPFMATLMFYLLIGFVMGSIVSGYSIYQYQKYRINESITLGGFVFDKKVYEIKSKTIETEEVVHQPQGVRAK